MTKADLIDEVSKVTELSRKDSEVIVETLFDSIIKALKTGDKLEVRGFGSFRIRERKAVAEAGAARGAAHRRVEATRARRANTRHLCERQFRPLALRFQRGRGTLPPGRCDRTSDRRAPGAAA